MSKNVNYHIKGQEFIIEDYNNSKSFASFFTGIAGKWGKPLWIFYVNRGQAISCLGTKDKDGAMIEFNAANKAYRQTPLQGFRTFIKINGSPAYSAEDDRAQFYEPFKNDINNAKNKITQKLHITSHMLKLVDTNKSLGIKTTVEYHMLPNEIFPALLRKLTLENISGKDQQIECIDGLPIIIPYGTINYLLKNISRLAEGWYNGVFFSKKHKIPVYKLPVEPRDRPEIVPVNSANFYLGFYEKNKNITFPEFIMDPDSLFGEVKDFAFPKKFLETKDFKINPNLTGKNKTPSGMGYFTTTLKKDDKFVYNSLIGHAHNANDIDKLVTLALKPGYFDKKQKENKVLINSITNDVLTKSSSQKFDNYCEQNFIDNLLRGGYPITLGEGKDTKNYYIYSRIHGDMEREYNDFMLLPEYFSQGNGNYRDVNQNRRSDIFFNKNLADETLITFMNLIQVDGFNPLKVLGAKFLIKNKKGFIQELKLAQDKTRGLKKFIKEPFSLGSFFDFSERENIPLKSKEKTLNLIIKYSEKLDYADPRECYWSDHWHYNIDLIENFLAIYPDKIDYLLTGNKTYTFFDNPFIVTPRSQKYVTFRGEPKQLDGAVYDIEKEKVLNQRTENPNIVRTKYGHGEIYKTNLLGKLLSLVANKYASLDPYGIGIEMETDKPNWCDALNGLPGIFGSSTAESFELQRLLELLKNSLNKISLKDTDTILVADDTLLFLKKLESATKKYGTNDFLFWDETHTIKEKYRVKTHFGLSGNEETITIKKLKNIINLFLEKVKSGTRKALDKKTGVILTNFEYIPTKFELTKNKQGEPILNNIGHQRITIKAFKQKPLPLFLEGPMHYLKTGTQQDIAFKNLHTNIMKSTLYDKELKMLKINENLKGKADFNIGRITIFTAGWLENESIWLHMEYKYMLELLRNNMSKEFFKLANTALVPFLDPKIYGRSIFENSSFIVSSAHPEKDLHGQGFVSRLSGSTAEFISMWLAITSGLTPFFLENNKLCLKFEPQIPKYLFTTKKETVEIYSKDGEEKNIILPENSFLFKLLGDTIVIYNNPKRKDTFGPDKAKINTITLKYKTGQTHNIKGDTIPKPYSLDVRAGKIETIEAVMN